MGLHKLKTIKEEDLYFQYSSRLNNLQYCPFFKKLGYDEKETKPLHSSDLESILKSLFEKQFKDQYTINAANLLKTAFSNGEIDSLVKITCDYFRAIDYVFYETYQKYEGSAALFNLFALKGFLLNMPYAITEGRKQGMLTKAFFTEYLTTLRHSLIADTMFFEYLTEETDTAASYIENTISIQMRKMNFNMYL